MTPKRVAWIAALAAVAAFAAMAAGRDAPPLVLINESASLPKGLYIRVRTSAPARDAIVAFPQPPLAKAYLATLGMPADVRLIKRVAAEGGELVCAGRGGLRLPRRTLRVEERDRFGVKLPAWRGCRRLGPAELFVVGDTPNSFDSRYFGPVTRAQVDGVFREAISW